MEASTAYKRVACLGVYWVGLLAKILAASSENLMVGEMAIVWDFLSVGKRELSLVVEKDSKMAVKKVALTVVE